MIGASQRSCGRSRSIRLHSEVLRGYHRESFQEAWESYLAPSIRYSATEAVNTERNGDMASATEASRSAKQK